MQSIFTNASTLNCFWDSVCALCMHGFCRGMLHRVWHTPYKLLVNNWPLMLSIIDAGLIMPTCYSASPINHFERVEIRITDTPNRGRLEFIAIESPMTVLRLTISLRLEISKRRPFIRLFIYFCGAEIVINVSIMYVCVCRRSIINSLIDTNRHLARRIYYYT